MQKEGKQRLFIVSLFISLFLAIFYSTATNMAGIYIVSDLGGSSHISVYSMVFFCLGNVLTIPLTKPLADRLGLIRLLVYALLFYTFFSILCAVASTFFLFNLFRLGMGLSSGLLYILCRKILLLYTPPSIAEKCSTLILLFYVTVPILGATVGAWLAYENWWRSLFHINEPVALLLAAYFWFGFREKEKPPGPFVAFDTTGYIFFALGIGALVTAATLSQQLDWYRSPTLVCLTLVGLPSFVFFILWELKSSHPLVELRLLKNTVLSYSLINLAFLFSAYFGMIILIALWLNLYANYTPWWISVLLGTMAVAGILTYFISKKTLKRFDLRITLGVAISSFLLSCYYSTYFDVDVDFFHLSVARFLAGLGLVLFLLPLFQMALRSHEEEKSDAIFMLFQLVRALFSGLGAGLYVILWQRRQVFFHERLSEALTVNSQLTLNYFQQATEVFKLTQEQSKAQLDVFLERQATSLALNDVFGFMGYILLGLLILLCLSFLKRDFKRFTHPD